MFAGGGLVTLGRHHGWRNLTPFPEPLKEMTLVTDGAYAYVRHPIYLGILLILIGYSLYAQNILQLVFALLLAVLLNFKSKQEEALLESTYPAYADYAAKVKRLLPGLI
jgi:protein-S-isoprenylcysteine O-methyltransferase Ste14